MLDLSKDQFLTVEQIREQAPSVFTKKGSHEVSDKYTHIPTDRIIEDMKLLGWGVVDAKEVKARKNSTKGFQKHLLVFRNDDVVINGDDGDTVFPQILLTNSHDGKNSFTFTAGLFRMVCENGLVVSTTEFENMKIRHMGYDFETLQETIKIMVEKLPLTVESMNKLRQTEMEEKQILEFARKALDVRFGENKTNTQHIKVDLKEFVTPTRQEDYGNDLWSVFNVVQEKIIEGDFEYTFGSKIRKARRIKNFKQDLELNAKLYDLALEYAG
jgi:hypothetical protein